MTVLGASLLIFLGSAVSVPADTSVCHKGETVILLHGLLNRPMMMKPLEAALVRQGYTVVNYGYNSRGKTVEDHARDLDRLARTLPESDRMHLVGFSLGGLIARYYLTHYEATSPGRLVMIAPPNHGSERAERLYRRRWFRWIWGTAAARQLRSTNTGFFESCGIPPREFGIIAGVKGDGKGYSSVLPGDDDGTVSVDSAWLPGAADFVRVRGRHTLLLFSPETIRQTLRFLDRGRFDMNDS